MKKKLINIVKTLSILSEKKNCRIEPLPGYSQRTVYTLKHNRSSSFLYSISLIRYVWFVILWWKFWFTTSTKYNSWISTVCYVNLKMHINFWVVSRYKQKNAWVNLHLLSLIVVLIVEFVKIQKTIREHVWF